jgi:1-phosphofructokinase family hexose kinase
MIYTVTLNPAVDRELTVPDIVFDTVLRATAWRVDCGGKGFNVSRMLQALGEHSVALAIAAGRSGQMLHDSLAALGIAADFVWVEGETRTNISIVTQDKNTLAAGRYLKVNEPGPLVAPAALAALVDKVTQLARPGDWWVLAGSLPPGLPEDAYAALITAVQTTGAGAVLDTSGPALRRGCMARPVLVKPNVVELGQLTGRPVSTTAEALAAARTVLQTGVANVVVSLGKAGALAVAADGAWLVQSPAVVEQNPIGAGDSMVAGLVWGLSRGLSLIESLRWGVACGAATASLGGTAVGSRSLVESLLSQAAVQPLPT